MTTSTINEDDDDDDDDDDSLRACGRGAEVDAEFERLLVAIFGADFIDVFRARRPAGWVDLMMAFESRKRAANPYKLKPLNVSLPFSFIDYHKKYRVSGFVVRRIRQKR